MKSVAIKGSMMSLPMQSTSVGHDTLYELDQSLKILAYVQPLGSTSE